MRYFILILSIIFSLGCSEYSRDPDLRLARDFIDAYFVLADQNAAQKFTSGRAFEEIKKEIELVKSVPDRQDAHRSRDIVFELASREEAGGAIRFFYKFRIIQPDGGETLRSVYISIDRKSHTVNDFRMIE